MPSSPPRRSENSLIMVGDGMLSMFILRRESPTFIEPKGYVFVGDSRRRMNMDNMPSPTMIREFSERLGGELGMEVLKERRDSRVAVLGPSGAKLSLF